MNVYERLNGLMLSQFQGKVRIDGIIHAIADELQEVYEEQQRLRQLLNIDRMEGKNLDNIGDIVCLSREEAQGILLKGDGFEMTDGLYRSVLRFIIAMHNSNATYYDIKEGLSLIWNMDGLTYREDRSRPATYILNLGTRDISEYHILEARTLTIRAAGVKALYEISWLIRALHDYWSVYVSKTGQRTVIPFFTGVRRWDGTWMLDGTYRLDAESYGIAREHLTLRSGKISHRTYLLGVEEIPLRLVVRTQDSNMLWVESGSAGITGIKSGLLSVSFEGDDQKIQTDESFTVSDTAEGLRVTGTYARAVLTSGLLCSVEELSGAFENDGIRISYLSDAEFSIESEPVKLW